MVGEQSPSIDAVAEHLIGAVGVVKRVISNSTVKRLHERYFAQTMSLQTFQRIVADPSRIATAQKSTQESFVQFARSRADHQEFQDLIYRGGLEALGGQPQDAMRRYIGTYGSFRVNSQGTLLVEGDIGIFASKNAGFYFEHTARQYVDGHGDHIYSHTGPVFILSDRLYLLGIGSGDTGSYLRPMILKSVDNPAKEALVGVVMTETTSHVPFSTKTVLIAKARLDDLRSSLGPGFEPYIREHLTNEARSTEVVRGWDRVRRSAS